MPNSINLSDLLVSFSQSLTSFSILVAPQDLNTDTSATLMVSAFFNSTLIGTATGAPPASGVWPSATLAFASAQPFNNVVVHYALPPPGGGDFGTIFVADNMIVTAAASPASEPGTLVLAALALAGLAVVGLRKSQ